MNIKLAAFTVSEKSIKYSGLSNTLQAPNDEQKNLTVMEY